VTEGGEGFVVADYTATASFPVYNVTQDTWHATIQAGINAAADGNLIQVSPGTYAENLGIDVPNLTLEGVSERNGVVIAPTAVDTGNPLSTFDGSPQFGIMVTADGVTIKNLTVDGSAGDYPDGFRIGIMNYDAANNYGDSLTLDNVNVYHSLRRGVAYWPHATFGHVIDGCEVRHVTHQNAIFSAAASITINDTKISHAGNAIGLYPDVPVASTAMFTVTNNEITDIAGSHSEHYGTTYPSGALYYRNQNVDQTVIITGNEITIGDGAESIDWGVLGMYIYNADENSLIQGNTIDSMDGENNTGIYLGGCAGVTLNNNTLLMNGRDRGIFLGRGATGTPVPNLITNNTLTSINSVIEHETVPERDSYGIAQADHAAGLFFLNEDPLDTYNIITGNEIHENGFIGNELYGLDASTLGTQIDASCNWWGHANGPDAAHNPNPSGDAVAGDVVYWPWLLEFPGQCNEYEDGNIVCIPDPLEISLTNENGGVYSNGLTVRYLGGGSGPMYSYSIDVEWDNTVVSATTSSFTRPAAGPFEGTPLFQVSSQGSDGNGLFKVRIDAALGGAHPGTYGPADLFAAVFTAVGTPDYAESDVDLTVRYVRNNQNQNLAGFVADDGLIIVDLVGPSITDVLLTNDTLDHTDDYVKDTDQITVTATITDGGGLTAADITADLTGLGGGAAVNPDTYDAGVATWVLTSVACTPSDGTVTVTVTATDALGNESSGSDTIIADNTAPGVVTGFTAAPGHNKVNLAWDDASGADDNYYGVMVRRVTWDSYPEYDTTAPDYPADETEGAEAFSGAATAFVDDDFDENGMDRGIYYYQAFVYDMALNYSPVGSASFDRSTNYWLGDVRPIVGTDIDNYDEIGDGDVATQDISALGATYYLPTDDTYWDPHCDVGPTDDNSRVGIPEPDDVVDFEDLMIFSMNYGVVAPLRDGALPEKDPADQPLLVLDCSMPHSDGILTAVVRLADHEASVAGFHARLDFDSAQMQVLSVDRGAMLDSPEVFFISVNVDQGLVLDGAALGGTLQGEGELVRVRFLVRTRGAQPRLGAMDLRDAFNRSFVTSSDELSERDSADVGEELALPTALRLRGAAPNPFLGQTQIQFELPEAMGVTVQIFDLNGRLVRTLSDGVMPAGIHDVTWNGRTNSNRQAAAGVYFCVLQAGSHNLNQKLFLKR